MRRAGADVGSGSKDDLELKAIGELDGSTKMLVPVDEAHRSYSYQLRAALRWALPNPARTRLVGEG